MTKHVLIFIAIVLFGLGTGGVGFLALLPWFIYGQVEAEMEREKTRLKNKWYGEYK